MRRKEATYRIAELKTLGDGAGEGTFEAIVAVFGNVDLVGDRIVKGAFAKSLAEWQASDAPIPVIWDHQWGNLDALAGEVLEAEELAPGDERLPEPIKAFGGLWVKGMLDIEDDFARKLWNKMRRKRVKEFSFAYDVVEEKANDGANELLELKIIEVGPTLKGANPATQLIGVKSDEPPKEAEEIAELKNAVASLQERLDAIESDGAGPVVEPSDRSMAPSLVLVHVAESQAALHAV